VITQGQVWGQKIQWLYHSGSPKGLVNFIPHPSLSPTEQVSLWSFTSLRKGKAGRQGGLITSHKRLTNYAELATIADYGAGTGFPHASGKHVPAPLHDEITGFPFRSTWCTLQYLTPRALHVVKIKHWFLQQCRGRSLIKVGGLVGDEGFRV
jgi:hypothetical protein